VWVFVSNASEKECAIKLCVIRITIYKGINFFPMKKPFR